MIHVSYLHLIDIDKGIPHPKILLFILISIDIRKNPYFKWNNFRCEKRYHESISYVVSTGNAKRVRILNWEKRNIHNLELSLLFAMIIY